eukprot:397150-Prymnesium_polylepis.1
MASVPQSPMGQSGCAAGSRFHDPTAFALALLPNSEVIDSTPPLVDVVATMKRQLQLLIPDIRVFLDVDNLESIDALEEYVSQSAA